MDTVSLIDAFAKVWEVERENVKLAVAKAFFRAGYRAGLKVGREEDKCEGCGMKVNRTGFCQSCLDASDRDEGHDCWTEPKLGGQA